MSHFKLMVDETYGKPVADEVDKIGGNVTTTTTIEQGFISDTPDETLIEYGHRRNWVSLTHDHNTIDENRYRPCSHAGIIIFKERSWFKETISASIKALRRSGQGDMIHHSVTYLYRDHAIIYTHHQPEPIKVKFRRGKA